MQLTQGMSTSKSFVISLILCFSGCGCLNAEQPSCSDADSFFDLPIEGPSDITDGSFLGIRGTEGGNILFIHSVDLNCNGTVRGVEFCYFDSESETDDERVFSLWILERNDANFTVLDQIPIFPQKLCPRRTYCCDTFWLNETSQFTLPEPNFTFGIESTDGWTVVYESSMTTNTTYSSLETYSEFTVGSTFTTQNTTEQIGHSLFRFVLDEEPVPVVTDSSITTTDSPLDNTTEDISEGNITAVPAPSTAGIGTPPDSGLGWVTAFSVALAVAVVIVLLVCLVIGAIVVAQKRNSRNRKSTLADSSSEVVPEPFSYTEYVGRTEVQRESTYASIEESYYEYIDDKESDVTQETEVNPVGSTDGGGGVDGDGALSSQLAFVGDALAFIGDTTTTTTTSTDESGVSSSNRTHGGALVQPPQETGAGHPVSGGSSSSTGDDGDVTSFSSNQAYGVRLAVEEKERTYENFNIQMATTLMFDGTVRPAIETDSPSVDVIVTTDIPHHQTDMVVAADFTYPSSETSTVVSVAVDGSPPPHVVTSSCHQNYGSCVVADSGGRGLPPDAANVVTNSPHHHLHCADNNMVGDLPHQTNMVTCSPHHSSMVGDPPHQTNMVTCSPNHSSMVGDPPHLVSDETNDMFHGGSVPPDAAVNYMVARSPQHAHQTNLTAVDPPNHTDLSDVDYVSMAADYIEPISILESMEEVSMLNVKRYSPAKSAAIISHFSSSTLGTGHPSSGVISSTAWSRHSCHVTTDTYAATTARSDALSSAYSLPQLAVKV